MFAVLKNTGDHNSVTCETILLDPKRDINKLSIGDLDGDGYPDLVTSDEFDEQLDIQRNMSTEARIQFSDSEGVFFDTYIHPVNDRFRTGTLYDNQDRRILNTGEISYEYVWFSGVLASGEVYRVRYLKKEEQTIVLQLITPDSDGERVMAEYPLASLFRDSKVWQAAESELKT